MKLVLAAILRTGKGPLAICSCISFAGSYPDHTFRVSLCSDGSDDEEAAIQRNEFNNGEANERTSLLPPSGISSSEQIENRRNYTDGHSHRAARRSRRKSRKSRPQNDIEESEGTVRWNDTVAAAGAMGPLVMDGDPRVSFSISSVLHVMLALLFPR